MEKWLYVIVGLTFISGLLGTAHHYYFVGVPSLHCSIGGFFSALEPAVFVAMSVYAYRAMRRSGLAHPAQLAVHWTLGSALFSALGAGLLGLAHTWPAVNKWTHGTLITPMHGHSAFFGAYVMIVLAVITYAMPSLMGHPESERESKIGLWAFWLQVGGMFGMTMAFAAAGIGQVYSSASSASDSSKHKPRSMHFLMLVATGDTVHRRVVLFLWDFFFLAPRQPAVSDAADAQRSDDSMRRDSPGVLRPAEQTSGERLHGTLRYPGAEAPYCGDRR